MINYLNESHDRGPDGTSAKTGGFYSYTTATDPKGLIDYNGKLDEAGMTAKVKEHLSWEKIKETPAFKAAADLNPRITEINGVRTLTWDGSAP